MKHPSARLSRYQVFLDVEGGRFDKILECGSFDVDRSLRLV